MGAGRQTLRHTKQPPTIRCGGKVRCHAGTNRRETKRSCLPLGDQRRPLRPFFSGFLSQPPNTPFLLSAAENEFPAALSSPAAIPVEQTSADSTRSVVFEGRAQGPPASHNSSWRRTRCRHTPRENSCSTDREGIEPRSR